MLNTLLVLYVIFFNSMGIAIIMFTVLVRLLTMPLTLKQIRQMRAMSELQPRMKEVQDRYGGDRARVSQETMKMYREAGVNPIGCLGPLVIQMPILIGLFRVLIQTPVRQSRRSGWAGRQAVPVDNIRFHLRSGPAEQSVPRHEPRRAGPNEFRPSRAGRRLHLGPAEDDHDPLLDPRQQSSQNMMQWMIPLFLGVFSLGWPSGLPLYWIVSNIIGISIQYFITGWGPLFPLFPKATPAPGPRAEGRR